VLGYARIQRQLHKIGLSREEVAEFAMKLMTLTKDTNLEDAIAADPDDDIFLACALAAGAQYLVSGDSHLLDLGQWRGIEMVTVNDFLAQHFPEDTTQ
jgi:predicted nucleic acid-binding protein